MVDSASAGEQSEDFGRESLQLNTDLEKMTEQMENISGNMGSIEVASLVSSLCN